MYQFSLQRPQDGPAIEQLLDQAFGHNRKAKQSYAYRRQRPPLADLCWVVRGPVGVVGSIRYWPITIGRTGKPALLLGPVAVERALQGYGLGGQLIEKTLDIACRQAHRRVILVGALSYYGRFGFEEAATHNIHMPGEDPRRVLIRELVPEALDGVAGPIFPPPIPPILSATG